MPSLQSRLFLFVLKHRHLFRFQLKRRATIDWNTSMPQLRQEAEKTSKLFGKLPKGIEVSPVSIDDFYAEWILPSQATKDKAILYFHGGGYVMGTVQAHRTHVAKFVIGSGIGALLFGYRLAPEHPFPGALDDSVTAYRWLLAQGVSPSHIVFVGDSAGGGLCLATLIALRDKNIPLPAGAVALSPWTDLKCTGESYRTKTKVDSLTWPESWTIFSKYYVGENDPGNPWISPLYGDLQELPSLLIYVGEDEVLLDDSTRFAKKAKDAGVDVTLKVGKGMFHCFPVCAPLFPEAKQAMDEICAFIKGHVNKSGHQTISQVPCAPDQ
jgi:monoterpene epsilon-lactone hydrolase